MDSDSRYYSEYLIVSSMRVTSAIFSKLKPKLENTTTVLIFPFLISDVNNH